MINRYNEQFYKIQLKWAADAFDAERRMRLAADERVAGARGLLMELVVHLLASELDDVRKKEDVTQVVGCATRALDEGPLEPLPVATARVDGQCRPTAARTGRAGDHPAEGGERATDQTALAEPVGSEHCGDLQGHDR